MKTMKAEKLKKEKVERKKASEKAEDKEFVMLQKSYKHAYTTMLYKGAEIVEMRRQLDEGPITMQWYGQPMPKRILALEHDLNLIAYSDLVAEVKYKEQALKNYGLSEEKIENVRNTADYVKEVPRK